MNVTITQYDLMSTSTCTPLGGGASTCTYKYIKSISTSTTQEYTPQVNASSTEMYQTSMTIAVFLFIGVLFTAVTVYLTQKLT